MLFARRNALVAAEMLTQQLDGMLLRPLFRKYSAHPPQITHYTTMETLEAILCSGNLRMTHFRHLNDSTEMLHGRGVINAVLGEARNSKDETAGFFDYCRFLFNEVGDVAIQCFLTSFSTLPDSPDLWARYGARCSDVAICFDTRRMGATATDTAPYYIGRVTYTTEEQRELVSPLVDAAKAVVSRYVRRYGYDVRDVAIQVLAARLCAHLNHHCISLKDFNPWHVEREWRTVFSVLANDPETRKARVKFRNDGRPFVDVPVLSVEPHDGRMPISAITVGSSADVGGVEAALRRHGYERVVVRQSLILEADLLPWP